jgi:hypothetical protein
MAPGPWNPAAELDAALHRGDLGVAVQAAGEVAEDRQRPLDLDVALRFLPLVAEQQPDHYDAWACRSLARWLTETNGATIDQAVDVAPASRRSPSSRRQLRGSGW